MKMVAGVCIDHRKAVIVTISTEGERTIEIKSNVEKQPGRFDGVRSTVPFEAQMVKADDSRERKFMKQLDQYYAEVIGIIGGAESLLIFGPGEAKGEFKNHLDHARFQGTIFPLETTDKMTDRQVTAKVVEHFHKNLGERKVSSAESR